MKTRRIEIRVLLLAIAILIMLIGNSWGQTWSADVVAGQTNMTTSGINALDANEMNWPYATAVTAGGKYVVADKDNNRVLIYNAVPTSNGAPANVVIGQTNFNENGSGNGSTRLNTPYGVHSDGTKLFIADQDNHRVLIYNSFPTSNGAPASVVVGQPDFLSSSPSVSQSRLSYPSAVYSTGTKLLVADAGNHRVMIWNAIPTTNSTPASVVVGQTNFTMNSSGTSSNKFNTPWHVSANGSVMYVTDTFNHRILKYNTIPTANGAVANVVVGQSSFTNATPGLSQSKLWTPRAAFSSGTKLYAADTVNYRALIWNSIPTTNSTPASVVLGQTNFVSNSIGASSNKFNEPTGVFVSGSKLYVTDSRNHRSLIYNSIPTANGAGAHHVTGHTNFNHITPNDVDALGLQTTSYSGSCVVSNKLVVCDTSNHRVLIWNSLPTNNAVQANVVIGQTNMFEDTFGCSSTKFTAPVGVCSDGTKLFVTDASNSRVLIYNTIPTSNGAAANVVVGQSDFTTAVGATAQNRMSYPYDVFVKSGKLYVADTSNNRVLIFNSIPGANGANASVVVGQTNFTTSSTGLSSTKYNYPSGVHTDGTKLFVVDRNNNRTLLYNTIPAANGAAADVVIGQSTFTNNVPSSGGYTSATLLYGPGKASLSPSGNRLYVADTVNYRVAIYDSIPTTNGAPITAVVGQTNFTQQSMGKSSSKLLAPSIAFATTNRFYVLDGGNNRLLCGAIPNSSPVLAVIGDKAIGADQTLSFVISATDADNGPSALTYSASNLPAGASFDPATRTFTWIPSTAQVGSYPNVHFEVSDGATTDSEDVVITVVHERYGFESGAEGWIHSTYEFGAACTNVVQSSTQAKIGTYSLKMNMNLIGSHANNAAGEASVDMRAVPPSATLIPVNLSGQTITAFVYCPTGSLGDPTKPNGIQIFIKDQEFDSQYSSFNNIVENTWMQISMTGTSAGSFDATKVIMVGVKMGAGGGSVATYNGPIYVDGYSFPKPAVPPSSHLYTFGTGSQDAFPRWAVDPAFGATAWTNAVLSSGTLAMSSSFTTSGTSQKGFIGITFQPDLYLVNKDHHVVHVELKFDPVPAPYQFVGSIWVYDHGGNQWYISDNKDVGAGVGWNAMEFDLDDNTAYNPNLGAGQTMPLDQILSVGVQLFANSTYTGTISLDNVRVGGEEIASNYVQLTTNFVGRSGTNFVLNGNNWFFAGANAEYFIKRPVPVVQQVLTSATNMNVRLVRTWAFDEGKPFSIQPERGKWNEAALEQMDRIIAESGKRNLRLLLALVDNWGHNGGMFKYIDWVAAEQPGSLPGGLTPNTIPYHDQFFTNTFARQWYKDYVSMLLNRTNTITGTIYKNDPAIMGWEIVNEPRNESDPSGAEIHNWLKEMSDYVRGIDSNHLITAGVEGGYITTYSNANTRAYQDFPDNYWQYGLKKEPDNVAANADFLSDGSSTNRTVYWQTGTYTNQGGTNSAVRVGIPNIDFLTCRLYSDQREYNLWRTNHFGYDQRIEWMKEHLAQAHGVLGKPLIVEEFGIHSHGWTYRGSFGEIRFHPIPAYNATNRVDIFETIYDYTETSGLNGTMFWNLGYDGIFEDPFNMCEVTTNWSADTAGSDATALSLNTNPSFITEGDGSLKMDYNASKGYSVAWYNLSNLSEKWIRQIVAEQPVGENRVRFAWRIYNPGSSITCAVAVSTTASLTWHEAPTQTLVTGWNTILFDLSSPTWKSAATGWAYNGDIANLEDVRRVSLGLFGHSGTGSVYADDITIWFDDGFVIYPTDSVVPSIRSHGATMNAK